MENIRKIFKEKNIIWFSSLVCVFHIILGLIHYFVKIESLLALDYSLIVLSIVMWIVHLIMYRVKPHLGSGFVVMLILLLWYLLSCQVMTSTYLRNWFIYNTDGLYDTLMLVGILFPLGIYLSRKGSDRVIQILIHVLMLIWTCFIFYVLIQVFQNKLINTPSGGQIGMTRNIALSLNCHYNTTGLIEMVMFMIALYVLFNSRKKTLYILYGIICLVNAVAMILSNSRTCFVAAVIILAAMTFSTVYNAKWNMSLLKKLLLAFAAAVFAAMILFLFRKIVFAVHENVTHLKALLSGSSASDNNSSARDLGSMRNMQSRFRIWNSALKAMTIDGKRFIFGVTPVSVTSAITEASGGSIENLYTHNQFLEVGVALGVPGMLLFILFVALLAIYSYRIAIKHNEGKKAWIIISMVVTLLIANLSEATLMFYRYLSSYPFFLLSGWICGTSMQQTARLEEMNRKNSKKKKK